MLAKTTIRLKIIALSVMVVVTGLALIWPKHEWKSGATTVRLSKDGKTLTVSGNGAMKDYSPDSAHYAPWHRVFFSIKNLIIDTGVTHIGKGAFAELSRLSSVTISDGVETIGDNAFANCSGLVFVTIPNSVTSIGSAAFRHSFCLTSVTISSMIEKIGRDVFDDCYLLKHITILNPIPPPKGWISLGDAGGLNGIPCIYVPKNSIDAYAGATINEYYSGEYGVLYSYGKKHNCFKDLAFAPITLGGVLFNYDTTQLIRHPIDKHGVPYTIPNGVKVIREYAFAGCTNLKFINIPNSVTNIGEQAFVSCASLTSVTIPDGVTSIDESAFANCAGLTSITIPNSVTDIDERAFADCTGLTSVSIPNSVTSISERMFENCVSLKSVTIQDGITKIGRSAFAGCTGLTTITIPNSVMYIDESAFWGCTNLVDITVINPVPPKLEWRPFPDKSRIYVPKGSLAAYLADEEWRKYKYIYENVLKAGG